MKQIKSIGLAIAMALALTALLGTASASASQFRAEEYPTSITGSQSGVHKFTLSNSSVTCETATLTGTASEASSALTVTPAYEKCKSTHANGVTANANSCKYVFHSTTEAPVYTGNMDIACSKEGDAIDFNLASIGCHLTFPAQTARATVEFTNTGKRSRSRTITATFNVSSLTYKYTGIFCPDPGTHENGSYTGTSVLKGKNETANHGVGIYVANEQVKSPPFFEGESYPLATQEEMAKGNQFQIGLNGGEITPQCNTMYGTGSSKVSGAVTALGQSVQHWNGCFWGGEFGVSMHSCSFTLNAVTSEFPVADGSLDIACPKGAEISFTIPSNLCKVTIPAQSGLNSLHFENTGSGASRSIQIQFAVSGIKYTESGTSCPKKGTTTYENGSFSGPWTLKGYEYLGTAEEFGEIVLLTGVQKGIWVE